MSHLMAGLVAIDDGGSSVKIKTKSLLEVVPSTKSVYVERNLPVNLGKKDFVIQYKNENYLMGEIAKIDGKYPLQMNSFNKQDDFFDISVLVACHQYGYKSNYVVVSSPVLSQKDDKENRIGRLKKTHTITVNGETKMFAITDVIVTAEAAVSYWSMQSRGKTRILDIGSRTINWASIYNDGEVVRFIDTESGTEYGVGLDDKAYIPKGLASYICGRLLRIWDKNDTIHLVGGGALDEELVSYIQHYFKNAFVVTDPLTCTVRGMYELGKIAYDMA